LSTDTHWNRPLESSPKQVDNLIHFIDTSSKLILSLVQWLRRERHRNKRTSALIELRRRTLSPRANGR
jgi:hypothetical protein